MWGGHLRLAWLRATRLEPSRGAFFRARHGCGVRHERGAESCPQVVSLLLLDLLLLDLLLLGASPPERRAALELRRAPLRAAPPTGEGRPLPQTPFPLTNSIRSRLLRRPQRRCPPKRGRVSARLPRRRERPCSQSRNLRRPPLERRRTTDRGHEDLRCAHCRARARPRGPARLAVRVHRAQWIGEDDHDSHDPAHPRARFRDGRGARGAGLAGGERPHRLPARGARAVQAHDRARGCSSTTPRSRACRPRARVRR